MRDGEPTALRFLPAAQARIVRSPAGTTWIWRPAREVMVTRTEGYLSAADAVVVESEVRKQLAEEGRHTGFHDWEAMTDYETEARVRFTKLALDVRPRSDGLHIIFRSKLVEFGVRAASLILREMRVHTSRASFEGALRDFIDKKSGPTSKNR